jgi:cation diffusion facilitator CzcD-associated flavoprotein CzcO
MVRRISPPQDVPPANKGKVVYTEEEKKRFAEDPTQYMDYRRKIEAGLNQSQLVTFRGTEIQKTFWKLCQDSMKEKLKKKPEVFESMCPQDKYPPGCRRLTPGPGYLEACVEDNVDVVTSGVARVVENGLYDDQGNFHEVDAIVYATGFN